MIYVSFITKEQAELTHLHAQAIKKIRPEANILYISKDPVKVASGARNIHGVDIESNGYNSLLNLLTALKIIFKNYDNEICITSVTSVIIGDVEAAYIKHGVNFLGFMANNSLLPLKSLFVINQKTLEKIMQYLSKKEYWDLFGRNGLEVLLGLALLVEEEKNIKLFQCVLPKADNALFAYFNSGFYTDIERLKSINICIEVDNMPYLAGYIQARLNLNEAIKRAMQHILHARKK